MLIVKINSLHTKTLQTGFAAFTDILGLARDSSKCSFLVSDASKLCAEENLVSMIFKDLAEQDLVGTEAVCVCCVPENASAGNILV